MKKPPDCSGGERSRVVFARGVIMKPQIILADEPTASLDEENKERIVNLLFKMNKEFSGCGRWHFLQSRCRLGPESILQGTVYCVRQYAQPLQ